MATLVWNGHDVVGTTAHRPTNVEAGQPYYDTDTGEWLVYTGSVWQPSGGDFGAGTAAAIAGSDSALQITGKAGSASDGGSVPIAATESGAKIENFFGWPLTIRSVHPSHPYPPLKTERSTWSLSRF